MIKWGSVMDAIYNVTMLVCIGLLAITVTVFVAAVSLLGRAIEEAGRELKSTVKQKVR